MKFILRLSERTLNKSPGTFCPLSGEDISDIMLSLESGLKTKNMIAVPHILETSVCDDSLEFTPIHSRHSFVVFICLSLLDCVGLIPISSS